MSASEIKMISASPGYHRHFSQQGEMKAHKLAFCISDIGFQIIQLAKIAEPKVIKPNTGEEELPLKQGLRRWKNTAPRYEKEFRKEACARILQCYSEKEETLVLDRLNLSSLPPEIGQLKHLRMLHLNSNKLSTLPPQIGRLKLLEKLNLHDNCLTYLPEEMASLGRLKVLILSANDFKSFPAVIKKLHGLKALNLKLNLLRDFPEEFKPLNHLDADFRYNSIRRSPPNLPRNIRVEKQI